MRAARSCDRSRPQTTARGVPSVVGAQNRDRLRRLRVVHDSGELVRVTYMNTDARPSCGRRGGQLGTPTSRAWARSTLRSILPTGVSGITSRMLISRGYL